MKAQKKQQPQPRQERQRSTPTTTPTAGKRKRAGEEDKTPLMSRRRSASLKSPGRRRESYVSAPEWRTSRAEERDIVLDRLVKELVPLLESEDSKRAARRRLCLGINEVTKRLEKMRERAVAAAKPPPRHGKDNSKEPVQAEGGKSSRISEDEVGRGLGLVVLCRDVRPASLITHLHPLLVWAQVPLLVFPAASKRLGEAMNLKTMAAFGMLYKQKEHTDDKTSPPAQQMRPKGEQSACASVTVTADAPDGPNEAEEAAAMRTAVDLRIDSLITFLQEGAQRVT